MCWCPDTQHLLVLTADMTIMLLPIINIILGGPTQTTITTPTLSTKYQQTTSSKRFIQKAYPEVC